MFCHDNNIEVKDAKSIRYLVFEIPNTISPKVFGKVFKCPQINMHLVFYLNTSFWVFDPTLPTDPILVMCAMTYRPVWLTHPATVALYFLLFDYWWIPRWNTNWKMNPRYADDIILLASLEAELQQLRSGQPQLQPNHQYWQDQGDGKWWNTMPHTYW